MERNLVAKDVTTAAQATRLRRAMTGAFPEATVQGFGALIPAMLNDEKDRHVAAAAIKTGAQVIVTSNLRDFQQLPADIEAQSPDEFLSNLADLDPVGMLNLVEAQAAALRRPPRSRDEVLRALTKTVPGFVELLLNQHL